MTNEPAEQGLSRIGIDDFARVEMRVGTVVTAEPVPNADRLLRLEVEVGEPSPRQIVAGIAAYYTPDEMVGRRIIVVANLEPRKLRGLESNGMLLAASGEGERPVLVTVTEPVPDGARLR
jgi:methionyl-tRNA synthetase